MATLTLYTNPMSRGRIVRWMLEELGQPYEAVVLGYGPDMNTARYLALNPMGKVPCLVHGNAVVTEGAAICTYLADAFPGAGLMAEDRARFLRWMFWGAGPLEAAISNKALGFAVPKEREGTIGYGSLDRVLRTLVICVEAADPYLAGPKFSALDVFLGSQIGWGMQFGTLPATPAMTDYWARVKDRPALKRAQEIDNALIPAKE